MKMMVSVREGHAGDTEQIQALVAFATQELRRIYRPRRPATGSTVPGRTQDPKRLVAVAGGRVVGVVEYLAGEDHFYIRGLAVDPGHRRQGVARALVQRVARLARESGKARLTLSTIDETGNPSVFARLGFVIDSAGAAPAFEGPEGQDVTQVDMYRMLP